ncbi:MAG: hypothetical protein QN191_02765 [Armatimonadota bacterium]|nr:hypothetical protein [Armatimonadota bacterium]MDR7389082.1 hypothetical protein [Armatimonadota bacterium]MDR7391501.1 hypothetical protein [Armatimonadota bacterium]MDR7595186.1 hypothetical protein [Armatimonadota bacterium]MDR7598856.1 hypothetical protein [Armatimonadota bacterium]
MSVSGRLTVAFLVLVAVSVGAFAAAGWASRTPHVHTARMLQALRDGDAETALGWVDVPSVAASVVEVLEEEWVQARAGDPGRYVASPLVRPLLRGVFGLARGQVQRRVEEELRTLLRRVAEGHPDAPVQLPRWGGFPVSLAAVLWFVDVQWLSADRVRLSAGPADQPWLRVEMAWRTDRWVVVAADREWVAALLRPRLVRPEASPPGSPEP